MPKTFLAMQQIDYLVGWHHFKNEESEKPEKINDLASVMQLVSCEAGTETQIS